MKILIAYDGFTHAETAITDLQWAGLSHNEEARVVSVLEWPLQTPRSWGMVDTAFPQEWTMRLKSTEASADAACQRIQKMFPGWSVIMETPTGHAAQMILERAAEWPADLIVAGTHGRSILGRTLLGSVSMKISKDAHCTVRIARRRTRGGPIRLLIGHDGSVEAEATVDEVCRRSWPAGTEARVLAVHESLVNVNAERIAINERLYDEINQDEHFRLDHIANRTAEKLQEAGLVVSSMVAEGNPRDTLVQEAASWNADTLFVGARGLGRVERFILGSVSSATLAHAPCSVEIVRHQRGPILKL